MIHDDPFTRSFLEHLRFAGDGNVVRAMKAAGFNGTDAEAMIVGERLLERPMMKRFFYTIEDTLAEYASIAFAPADQFLKVKLGKNGDVIDARLELADKLRALDAIAEYQGVRGVRRGKKLRDKKEVIRALVNAMERHRKGSSKALLTQGQTVVKES